MLFSEVVGQSSVKSHLISLVQKERVPHAQLFLEKDGAGGLPLALAFAQYLNCTDSTEEDSCGKCTSCVKTQKLIHPDLHFTYPVVTRKPGKPALSTDFISEWREAVLKQPYQNRFEWLKYITDDNKQGNITRDECRRIISQLQLKSFEGKFKILILWGAEALGGSSNVLLKLIEEPPPYTSIIIIASNQEQLLTTITSRTQILPINRIEDSKLIAALSNRFDTSDEERLQKIAHLSEGNYRKAISLLDHQSTEFSEELNFWLVASMNNQAAKLVDWIQANSGKGREYLKQFFEYLQFFFRECLIIGFANNQMTKLSLKERSLAERVVKFSSLEKIEKINDLLGKAHYQIERNCNSKIVLLDTSIKVSKILRGKSIPKT